MKDNLYARTMENMKAPQKMIDNTIEQIKEAGENSTVIAFEKPKRRALKFVSAVAAVLALIIGLSVIPFGDSKNADDIEHNFVLKVGAAEITPDVYVEIGELSEFGSGASFKPIDQEAATKDLEDGNVEWRGEYYVMSVGRFFMPHELNVQGNNIESITYATNNCRLAYDSQFEGILNVEEMLNEELSNGVGIHYYNKYLWAKSCTFDYQSQLDSIASGKWRGIPKIGVEFAFEFEEGEHTVFIEDDLTSETPLFVQEFNAYADEFSLDITANFSDGVSVTKTLKFSCENTEDRGLVLYAIEA